MLFPLQDCVAVNPAPRLLVGKDTAKCQPRLASEGLRWFCGTGGGGGNFSGMPFWTDFNGITLKEQRHHMFFFSCGGGGVLWIPCCACVVCCLTFSCKVGCLSMQRCVLCFIWVGFLFFLSCWMLCPLMLYRVCVLFAEVPLC